MPAREILNFTPCLVFFGPPSACPPCHRAIARFHSASGASELNNLDILTDWSSEGEKISGWGGLYMSKCLVQVYTFMYIIYNINTYHNNHQWQLVRSRAGLLLKPSKPPQMGSSWNTEDTNPPQRVTPRDVKSLDFGCGQWCDLDLITWRGRHRKLCLSQIRSKYGWKWMEMGFWLSSLHQNFGGKLVERSSRNYTENRDEIGMWMATLRYFCLVDGISTVLYRFPYCQLFTAWWDWNHWTLWISWNASA